MADPKKPSKKKASPKGLGREAEEEGGDPDNGMKAFSMHLYDAASAHLFTKLSDERKASPSLSIASAGGISNVDPETVASRILTRPWIAIRAVAHGPAQRNRERVQEPRHRDGPPDQHQDGKFPARP